MFNLQNATFKPRHGTRRWVRPAVVIIKIAIWASCFVVAALICSIRYHNKSFDMGLHYALVSFFADQARMPICGVDAYLESLCSYPPIPHIFASMIGRLVGSNFWGMFLLIGASTFAIYGALAELLRFEKDRATVLALGMLCVVCLVSCPLPSILGAEVRRNFFFGQLAGAGALFAFVACWECIPPIVALAAVFLFGWIYPIAAIQLAGATIFSMILARRPFWQIAAFTMVAGVEILFHPLFRSSASFASNDGSIFTGLLPSTLTVPLAFLLAALVLILSLLHLDGRIPLRKGNTLVSLAAGIVGAALAQWLAFKLAGLGSPYIVAKHLFGVSTMLAACLIVATITLRYPQITTRPLGSPLLISASTATTALLCVTLVQIPIGGSSMASFVAVEREVKRDNEIISSLGDARDRFALEVAVQHQSITPTALRNIAEDQAQRASR